MAKVVKSTPSMSRLLRGRAKALLERKGVAYEEIDVLEDTSRRDEMVKRAHGGTTVPQIFIDGAHIGGSDELVALDAAPGKLDLIARALRAEGRELHRRACIQLTRRARRRAQHRQARAVDLVRRATPARTLS